MTENPLDRAHAAMTAAPGDDALRLAYYGCLADAPLVLHLSDVPAGNDVSPEVLEIDGLRFVLAFNGEERLADHAGGAAAYAAVSGRALAEMLSGQGVGIAVDRGLTHEMLLPPEAVAWLTQTLSRGPKSGQARPVALRPAPVLPDALERAIARKLDGAGTLAAGAWLALAEYSDGSDAALIVFVGAAPHAESGLATAISEALTFSGIEGAVMDVTFAEADDPLVARIARVGRELPLGRPAAPEPPKPPGMDPDQPPKLR